MATFKIDLHYTVGAGTATTTTPFSHDQLEVVVSPEFCRHTTPELDALIDARWDQKRSLRPGAKLFNALKFRLAKAEAAGDEGKKKMRLLLGITDYKAHTGTNVALSTENQHWPEEEEQKQDQDSPNNSWNDDEMAHALGVEACVVTTDNKIVLFKRSQTVADFPGYFCAPGGHAEPHRVLEKLAPEMQIGGRLDEKIPAAEVNSKICVAACDRLKSNTAPEIVSSAIVDELFHSIVDEILSELGLPGAAHDAESHLVQVDGVVSVMRATDANQRGKPDVLFAVRVGVRFEELKGVFAERRGEDAFEAEDDSLVGIPIAHIDEQLAKMKVAPASLAAIAACKPWLATFD